MSQGTRQEAAGGFCRDVTACILDRPRHADIIRQCREAGARIRLISDGDVAGESPSPRPCFRRVEAVTIRASCPCPGHVL